MPIVQLSGVTRTLRQGRGGGHSVLVHEIRVNSQIHVKQTSATVNLLPEDKTVRCSLAAYYCQLQLHLYRNCQVT